MHKLKYFLTLATVPWMPCSFLSPLNFSLSIIPTEVQLPVPEMTLTRFVCLQLSGVSKRHRLTKNGQNTASQSKLPPGPLRSSGEENRRFLTREESSKLQYLTVSGRVWHMLKVERRVFYGYSDSLQLTNEKTSFLLWFRRACTLVNGT